MIFFLSFFLAWIVFVVVSPPPPHHFCNGPSQRDLCDYFRSKSLRVLTFPVVWSGNAWEKRGCCILKLVCHRDIRHKLRQDAPQTLSSNTKSILFLPRGLMSFRTNAIIMSIPFDSWRAMADWKETSMKISDMPRNRYPITNIAYRVKIIFKVLRNWSRNLLRTWFSWQGPWQYSVKLSRHWLMSPTLISLIYKPSRPRPPEVLPQIQSRNCSVSWTKL